MDFGVAGTHPILIAFIDDIPQIYFAHGFAVGD